MGYMTEISILNDGLGEIENDPEQFVENIKKGIYARKSDSYGIGNFANPMTVHPSHHADTPKLVLAWRNSFIDMSSWGMERDFGERLLKNDYLIKVMEENLKQAQYLLDSMKDFLLRAKKNV